MNAETRSTGRSGHRPNRPLFIAIDLGTSGVKVLALDADGHLHAAARRGYPTAFPRPGWVEQDPDAWWAAVRSSLRDVVRSISVDAVRGIGLSGQMKGLVMVRADGSVVRPCILYTDARSAAEAAELSSRFGPEIWRRTGQPVRTPGTLTKLVWIRRHEPQSWEAAERFLLPKDFVRLRLTGRPGTDVTDAAGTLLYDLGQRAWAADLAERLDLRTDIFPEVSDSSAVTGSVTRRAASETGLPEGTPVVAGGADMACTVLGAGLIDPGDTCITISSAGQVLTVTEQPAAVPGLSANPHVLPGLSYLMASSFSGGLALSWTRDLLSGGSPSPDIGGLEAEVAQVELGAEGLLFLPYLLGVGTPAYDPDVRGAFLGVSAHHRRAHFVRAVMEGVALHLRQCVELVEQVRGAPVLPVIGAGGARSAVWRQIVADVLQRPLQMPGCLEFAGLGAAVLAGVGSGVFPDVKEAVSSMVHRVGTVAPNPDTRGVYQRKYEWFLNATDWLLRSGSRSPGPDR